MTPPDPQSKYLFPEELGENYRKPLIRCICVCVCVYTGAYIHRHVYRHLPVYKYRAVFCGRGKKGVVHIHNIEPLSFFLSFFLREVRVYFVTVSFASRKSNEYLPGDLVEGMEE